MALTAFICARRIRVRNKKHNGDAAIPFQPTRRPTAVRSPSGQPPQYFKKSPSPTAPKPLPGTLLTPQDVGATQATTTVIPPTASTTTITATPTTQSAITTSKYMEENEISSKIVAHGNDSNGHKDLDSPTGDGHEYGKLGSLVFKLRYLNDRNALVVSVVRCRGLPGKVCNGDLPAGLNGKTQTATDPYVKLQLLPEKQHKVKTRYNLLKSQLITFNYLI